MSEWTSLTDDEWPEGYLSAVEYLHAALTQYGDAAYVGRTERDPQTNTPRTVLAVTNTLAMLVDVETSQTWLAERGNDLRDRYARLKLGCVHLVAMWIQQGETGPARELVELLERTMPDEVVVQDVELPESECEDPR